MKDDKYVFTKYVFIAFIVLLIYLSYLMVKPYISVILLSLLIAYIIYPLNTWLTRLVRNRTVAALILTLLILAILVVPLVLVGNLLVTEAAMLYQKVDINQVESFFSTFFKGQLDNYIGPFLQKALEYVIGSTSNFLFTLPQRVVGLLIGLAVLFFTFRDGHLLGEKIRMILPLRKSDKEKVIERFKSTMDAAVYGTVAIAVVEGIVASIGFWLFGVKAPVLWGLVTAVVSMLPFLGPAIVWLPITVIMYFQGNVMGAFGLGLFSLLVLTLGLDIFLKNKIIGKKGKIHPAVVLLGVIGGVSVFGVVGFILGPFILSLLILSISFIFSENEIKSKGH